MFGLNRSSSDAAGIDSGTADDGAMTGRLMGGGNATARSRTAHGNGKGAIVLNERGHPDEALDDRDDHRDESRRYDSFVIRLWRHPGQRDFMRAEVRHVQSGTSQTGFDCTGEWIQERILERVAEDDLS